MVDFSESSAGINVDLRITLKPVPGLGGYSQGDLLNDVENVVGSRLADTLIGDGGDNRFTGGAGNDRLDGGGGDDWLKGGGGEDSFVFTPSHGQDRIRDFDANPAHGQDVLDLSAFDILAADFARRVTISDVGTDTLLTIDGDPHQTILLAGVGNSKFITEKDFIL
jgi:Ca2+-binding RTX toxin-like protein